MTELALHFAPDMPAAAVEVLDADARPLHRLWMGPGQTERVEVPSLDAAVQVFLPSGQTVTLTAPGADDRAIAAADLRAEGAPAEEPPLHVRDAPDDAGGPSALLDVLAASLPPPPGPFGALLGTALLAKRLRSVAFGAGDARVPRLGPYAVALSGDRVRVREILRTGSERGLLFEPPGIEAGAYDLTAVSESGAALTVRLPGSLAQAHVTLSGDGDGGEVLRVRVATGYPTADTLGAYLARGDLRAAAAMTSWAEQAEGMLSAKMSDPDAAAVGAYLLLRLRRFDLLHDWPRNLADWFPTRSDGCVIWAWQLVHQGGDLDEAQAYLVRAAERPLPVFSEGLRLLLDGLAQMGEPGAEALAAVRKRAGFVLWDTPFTAGLHGGRQLGPETRVEVAYATGRVEVVSSALASIGYADGTLTVEFDEGRSYAYDGVPPEVYEAFLRAESKGAFFNESIRDGQYESRRL